MAIFDIDLTTADLMPDGDYVATISKVEPKISGDQSKNPGSVYLSWMLKLTTGKVMFHNTPMSFPSMVKSMMDASKTPYTPNGFDPDLAVGKQVNIRVGTKDDPTYGLQNNIVKVWAV